jgi:small subunit ribosomal protein S18
MNQIVNNLGSKDLRVGTSLKSTSNPRNFFSSQKNINESSTKKNSVKKNTNKDKTKKSLASTSLRRRKVLSVSQLLLRVQKQKQRQLNQKKRQKPVKPIIPPKSLIIILKDKPEKAVYNRRIIDYKHCGLLQRYIGLGGKILPRRQTKLTAKQQRYIAKTIKSARIMGLLPFVTKERGFFR